MCIRWGIGRAMQSSSRNRPGRRLRSWPRRVLLLAALAIAGAAQFATADLREPATLDLGNHRGQVVVLDFWASWCTPCRRSLPWLDAMQAKYARQGLVVIGVNVDRDKADPERFLQQTPVSFRIVYDASGTLPERYGVTAMPSSLVFDRTGKLAVRHLGFVESKRGDYETNLQTLLTRNEEDK
jgi:thiol-disulfide isomerase/thioredoxin